MNGEQALAKIRSTIQQKIAETPAVQKLIDKINSGKATYADTALYARWAAINLGMCLSGVICDIDLNDRAAVCKALMLDQYRDINGFVDIVQSELDSRFGIQLAPQRAPFNKERADTIGHSLADTTKPDEVIERRAENAVANAVESMHDDRMQAESKFRSRLGLTVVIERTGANCCPWCAEVAGKYRYGDEPEGVFRRHDNCNCTIIYDSQVLRGAVGEDGRRTKKWEEVNPEKVRGFEPTVNTPEQAKELEETALQGLTLENENDIIRERTISGQRPNALISFGETVNTGSSHLTEDAKQILLKREKEIVSNRTETAILFDAEGNELLQAFGDASRVTFTPEELKKMPGCILTHNHPDNSTFSPNDVSFLLHHNLAEIRVRIKGGIYLLQRTKTTVSRCPTLDAVVNAYYKASKKIEKKYQDIAARNGRNVLCYLRYIEEETVMQLAKKYKLNYILEVIQDE